ncbi:MAG: hypothetical protein A2167_02765 [Planctomycetes bacterium RBG_13_46_10]|nr:MAG: hypothetical protein A2167_02765 [Planctomycetes bacterium RBG_13_46_10]
MPILKPPRAIQLNTSHPLARDLASCWLFNSGAGEKAFDSSGNNNSGIINGDISWAAGKFGSALSLGGSSGYVNCGSNTNIMPNAFTVVGMIRTNIGDYNSLFSWRTDSLTPGLYVRYSYDDRAIIHMGASNYRYFYHSPVNIADGNWHHVAFVVPGNAINDIQNSKMYADGKEQTVWATYNAGEQNSKQICSIGRAGNHYFNGNIDHVMVFNRVLTASEIAQLYREPFCMFERMISPAFLIVPTIDLVGTSISHSTALATLKRLRRMKCYLSATTDITAILKIIGEVLLAGSTIALSAASGQLTLSYRGPWLKSPLKTERHWLTDALFTGMTSNAFKLGTVLTDGWFWMRPSGCTAFYRGLSMEQIDFSNILAVVEKNSDSMSLSENIPHNGNSTYFYVVRKFNNCGCQEYTLQAAVRLALDADGNLDKPQSNSIFAWRASQVDNNKIQLLWFYSPLEQKSQPVRFKVYYNNGTGQIDYGNPIDEIAYKGQKFYSWNSDELTTGRYLFAIRAEDATGLQDNSLAQITIEIAGDTPDAIEILKVETL